MDSDTLHFLIFMGTLLAFGGLSVVAERFGRPMASSACPICGQDFPHSATDPIHAAAVKVAKAWEDRW